MNAFVRNGERAAIKIGKSELKEYITTKEKSIFTEAACRKEDTDPGIIILGNRIKRIKIAAIKLLFFSLSCHVM